MAAVLMAMAVSQAAYGQKSASLPVDTTNRAAMQRAVKGMDIKKADPKGDDPLDQRLWLPGERRQPAEADTGDVRRRNVYSKIALVTRTYADSVVLRWMPEDYASWMWLRRGGYNVVRLRRGAEGYEADTLARALKPLTLEQMRARYAESDSLAMVAAGLMYGKSNITPPEDEPGSMGALVDQWEQQQNIFGYAMLVSEWRRDLALDMALCFVDRTARAGETYTYVVSNAVPDTTGAVLFEAGVAAGMKNVRYQPEKLNLLFADSVLAQNVVELRWTNMNFSSYRIERRRKGETVWQSATDKPYVPSFKIDGSERQVPVLQQELPGPGLYEYRVFGYDAFGDLQGPSNIHTVEMGDIQPPMMPELHSIVIDRPDKSDLGAKIIAHINFGKQVKEPDFIGYGVLYYHDVISDGQWMPLSKELIPPTDTTLTVDVTALETGWIVIAAADTAGNTSYSMPQLLRVADLRPPHAPAGLHAQTYMDGRVELMWNRGESDIDYYEIAMANDTTHNFQIIDSGKMRDTVYVDSIATDLNQKYIYYKVRAVDHSTNVGEWSDVLQVLRPHSTPPDVARLDDAREDADGIYLTYIGSGEATVTHHIVYRHCQGDKQWQQICRIDGDSLLATGSTRFTVVDQPEYEQQRRYEYCVETFNTSGISSGASLAYAVYHRGPQLLDIPVTLSGTYDRSEQQTRLAWELDATGLRGDYYFVVYRKTDDESSFRFVTSMEKGELSYADVAVRPGHSGQY